MKLVAVSNYFKLMTWMALDVFCPRYFSISGSEVIQIELQNMAGKLPGPSLLLSPSLSISVALWTHSFCFFSKKTVKGRPRFVVEKAAICIEQPRFVELVFFTCFKHFVSPSYISNGSGFPKL